MLCSFVNHYDSTVVRTSAPSVVKWGLFLGLVMWALCLCNVTVLGCHVSCLRHVILVWYYKNGHWIN